MDQADASADDQGVPGLGYPSRNLALTEAVVNDPKHAAVINQLQINPLRFCPQQAKVPWTKLMHEQMIKAY